jgi:Sjoegren syndrome nuclear autoantigen 1
MASLGADLQSTNNELVAIIEQLKAKRGELDQSIHREEEQRRHMQAELQALTARLKVADESLAVKHAARDDFDKTIQETAVSFAHILDSSKSLLSAVKRDSMSIGDAVKRDGLVVDASAPAAY